MKNKEKIIMLVVLITFLVIVVGVSYAYFTSAVKGNEEAKKIEVEAAIMSVKLTGPDEITAEHLIPGQSVSITFQVENTGTVPAYYNLDMIEVTNNFNPTSDLVYTVTSTNNGGHVEGKEAPKKNETLIRNILIEPGKEKIQEYTLTLLFKETQINQDTNQDKNFEGKVQINNLEDNTLATRIVRTSRLQTEEPDFTKGYPNTIDNDSSLSGLYAAQDDNGTSYYFRGAVENNNVTFANMNWKIIRINGDGTIRLILADKNKPSDSVFNNNYDNSKYVGYTYDNKIHNCTTKEPCEVTYDGTSFSNDKFGGQNSIIKEALETWYKNNLSSVNGQIAYGLFCNDISYYTGDDDTASSNVYYGVFDRLNNTGTKYGQPTLICPDQVDKNGASRTYGGLYKTKIGLITADEMDMAGISTVSSYTTSETNYLYYYNGLWLLSPSFSDNIARVSTETYGYLNSDSTSATYAIFPVINLRADVTFTTNGTGNPGTSTNPYTVQ